MAVVKSPKHVKLKKKKYLILTFFKKKNNFNLQLPIANKRNKKISKFNNSYWTLLSKKKKHLRLLQKIFF